MQPLHTISRLPAAAKASRKVIRYWILPLVLLVPLTAHAAATKLPPPGRNQAAGLETQVGHLAGELFRNLVDSDPQNGALADGLMVCSFVDLKKLNRTSSFGRYLAERLMTEFQQQHYPVVEMRKSLSVLVQEKRGEYGLSRNPGQISPTIGAGAMLTGTYMMAGNHVIVNARILDNRTAVLLSSSTVLFPRNELSEALLADSVSATVRQREPFYIKRLEL